MKSVITLWALTQATLAFAIYHGEAVVPADPVFASTVALLVPKNGTWEVVCSGTVVAPRLVVAAAHCVAQHDYREMAVGFGMDATQSRRYPVTHLAYPSGYYDSTLGNHYRGLDVLVLQVSQPFSAPLRPVPLAYVAGEPDRSTLLQAGFGYTDLAETEGLGFLWKLFGATVSHESLDPDKPTQQFTLTNGNDASTLRGDSGGPVYVIQNGALSLRGILSGGGALSRRNSQGSFVREMLSIYTDVVYFHDWLTCASGGSYASVSTEGLPPQIRCRRGDRLFPISELAAHNEQLCGGWLGWHLVARQGESDKSTCWPGTLAACETYAKFSGQPLKWNDTTQSCR